MPIENRNLEPGMRLAARYKGKQYVCEVIATANGLRYKVNGKEFTSPSSAGREITGGATNGWRFFSLEGDLKERKSEPKPKTAKKAPAKKTAKTAKSKGKRPAKKKVARAAAKGDKYGCGACGETFPTMKAATTHALGHTSA